MAAGRRVSGGGPVDEYLEEGGSPIVDLADVVARLQKEVVIFGYYLPKFTYKVD